jgi:hypothetical protein
VVILLTLAILLLAIRRPKMPVKEEDGNAKDGQSIYKV